MENTVSNDLLDISTTTVIESGLQYRVAAAELKYRVRRL